MLDKNVSSRNRFLGALLFIISGLAGIAAPAHALNGDTFLYECENCASIYDFELFALQTSQETLNPGLYIVTSKSQPRTAYVKVSGTPMTYCDIDCYGYMANHWVRAVDEAGNQTWSIADLERIDEAVFGLNRKSRLPTVTVPSNYAGSIINSLDEEVGPGISQALVSLAISPGSIPVGTKILVQFADGTKAQFIKVSNTSSIQWMWTGKAWNANGQPINRSGQVVQNPNTVGLVQGSISSYGIGFSYTDNSYGTDWLWSVFSEMSCKVTTTIIWNGSAKSISIVVPC